MGFFFPFDVYTSTRDFSPLIFQDSHLRDDLAPPSTGNTNQTQLNKRPFRGFQNKVNFKTNRQQAKLKWSYNKDQQQGGALFLLLQPLPKIPSDARAGVGGRLSHFIKEWAEITSNPFILQMIEVTGWNSKTPHPRGFFLPICRGTKRDGRPL